MHGGDHDSRINIIHDMAKRFVFKNVSNILVFRVCGRARIFRSDLRSQAFNQLHI